MTLEEAYQTLYDGCRVRITSATDDPICWWNTCIGDIFVVKLVDFTNQWVELPNFRYVPFQFISFHA